MAYKGRRGKTEDLKCQECVVKFIVHTYKFKCASTSSRGQRGKEDIKKSFTSAMSPISCSVASVCAIIEFLSI